MLRKYGAIWTQLAAMSLMTQMSTRLASAGYFLGKLIRFAFFFIFIVAIFQHTKTLAGYSLAEAALFFLTFNLVDILAQMFFRGVYSIRRIVLEGEMDFFLIQPVHSLFRVASYMMDFIDLLSLLPILIALGLVCPQLPGSIAWTEICLYVLLLLNALLISFSIHVAVAAVAVRTQELENTIWIYRDLMALGRFPVDIYAAPLRWVLTLAIPIAVMTSFPSKALLGVLSGPWVLFACVLSALTVGLSQLLWQDALKRYTSVSS